MLQALLQPSQDEAEVQKAIDQFHKDAREFQKAVSTRNQVRWALSGKERLTQAVENLDEYTNALFEITKHITPVVGPSISNTLPGALNTSFKEYSVRVKLPFRRNPKFSGRKDILDRICEILEPDNQVKQGNLTDALVTCADVQRDFKRKTVVLHGLGGMGKSQIALEYAHQFSRFYTAIFWIDADDISHTTDSACKILDQLVTHYKTKWRSSPDLQEIVNILGIAGSINPSGRLDKSATDAAMETVHHWLSATENRDWLLLVDNHDKPKDDQLDDLIPACDWGSVIITTRLPNLSSFGECVAVEGIGADAGLDLLLKSSGKSQRGLDESELREAREIVKVMGELPLGLDQAGAYISSLQLSFSVYRERIRKGMKVIFSRKLLGPNLSSAKASVLTTWELSFQELSDDAQHLLHLCAFLSNEDIPEELFHRGKSAACWIEDENKLNDAIENLFAFSLVKRKDLSGDLWVHPLVHAWAREHTDSTIRRQHAEEAITLVATAVDKDQYTRSPDDWIFERRILNHLNVCQKNISEHFTGSDSVKIAEATSSIGSAYDNLGYYKQAEELFQMAFAGYEKALGKDHRSSLAAINNLAMIFDNQGRYDEALEWHQRALEGKEKVLGKDHVSTLDTLHNMALVLDHQERYDDALECLQRALAGYEKTLGKDHPSTLGTVGNMASVFDNLERYDEALEWHQRSLEGYEKALGKDHPSTLIAVDNMASLLDNQGKYDEALELYERSLAGCEKNLGKDHPSTADTVYNMAIVFENQKRHNHAVEYYQRALVGYEKALGRDHPSTRDTVDNLAGTLRNMERYDEAEKLEKQYSKSQRWVL
ncbi:hypothetical protein RUND412_011193 [Rhizina undulata]